MMINWLACASQFSHIDSMKGEKKPDMYGIDIITIR